MKNAMVMCGIGVALACVTTGGLLGVQGRLNHEGTKEIPVLRWMFPAPPNADGRSVPRRSQPTAKTSPVPTTPKTRRPGASRPVDALSEANAPPDLPGVPPARGFEIGQLFDLAPLEATGLTVHDVNALVARAQSDRAAVASERAELERARRELELREKDVAERYAKLQTMLDDIVDRRRSFETDVKTFNERVTVLYAAERQALLATASSIARLKPAAGAELIREFYAGDNGPQKVVKILAVMVPERADEILGSLDPKLAREILECRMSLIEEPRDARASRRSPR